MKVYQKLNAARKQFHTLQLKKTGLNKFAGYQYFELGDFLIPALNVFEQNGLCAFISFGKDLATMTIVCAEDGSSITLTSPMAEAQLKGCHPIQNLGAVETYTRRYLWVAALEIVEHDAIDAGEAAKPDVSAIMKGIATSTNLALLKSNFTHAMQMLDTEHHAAITSAKDKRKAELQQKESA